MTTIGIRQNNPGNIRRVKGVTWEGQTKEQGGSFVRFIEPKWGIRAIVRTLITYADARKARDGSRIDTVQDVIDRWAPPVENNTDAYAAHVRDRLDLKPGEIIQIKEPRIMEGLVRAIIMHENGEQPYTTAQIHAGMVLAGIEPERAPLQATRTVKGGQVAGVGTILTAANEILEPAKEQVAWLAPYWDGAKWLAIGVIVVGLAAMLWARIDDRLKGLR